MTVTFMPQPSPSYREKPQTDLFPDERRLGPVLKVLEEHLDPAGFSALKKYGQRLERLIEGQQQKSKIRAEYFRLKFKIGSNKAQQKIMEKYNLEYDLFDKIIYPRIGS